MFWGSRSQTKVSILAKNQEQRRCWWLNCQPCYKTCHNQNITNFLPMWVMSLMQRSKTCWKMNQIPHWKRRMHWFRQNGTRDSSWGGAADGRTIIGDCLMDWSRSGHKVSRWTTSGCCGSFRTRGRARVRHQPLATTVRLWRLRLHRATETVTRTRSNTHIAGGSATPRRSDSNSWATRTMKVQLTATMDGPRQAKRTETYMRGIEFGAKA